MSYENQICIRQDNLEKIQFNINGEVIYDESVKLKDDRIAALEEVVEKLLNLTDDEFNYHNFTEKQCDEKCKYFEAKAVLERK